MIKVAQPENGGKTKPKLPTNCREETAVNNAVNSESDQRVINNTMRHKYRPLSDKEKSDMVRLKDLGLEFTKLCDEIGSSREMSIAKTKAEESVMWAVKHITA
jgi:hypothetical protein